MRMFAHCTSAEAVQAIRSAVDDLGFAGGKVLKPDCGSDYFIGFAAPGFSITGAEFDPDMAESGIGKGQGRPPNAENQSEGVTGFNLRSGRPLANCISETNQLRAHVV